MKHKVQPNSYEKEFEEDLLNFNYSKKYNKFMVRDHKLQKRKNKAEDWYD
jgi:hypothetical protein